MCEYILHSKIVLFLENEISSISVLLTTNTNEINVSEIGWKLNP